MVCDLGPVFLLELFAIADGGGLGAKRIKKWDWSVRCPFPSREMTGSRQMGHGNVSQVGRGVQDPFWGGILVFHPLCCDLISGLRRVPNLSRVAPTPHHPKKGPYHISPANWFINPHAGPRFVVDLSGFPTIEGPNPQEFINRFAGDM